MNTEQVIVKFSNDLVRAMGHVYALDDEVLSPIQTIRTMFFHWQAKNALLEDSGRKHPRYFYTWFLRRGQTEVRLSYKGQDNRAFEITPQSVHLTLYNLGYVNRAFGMYYRPGLPQGERIMGLYYRPEYFELDDSSLDLIWRVNERFTQHMLKDLNIFAKSAEKCSKGEVDHRKAAAFHLLEHHKRFLVKALSGKVANPE